MNLERESQLGAHAVMWAVMNKRQEVEDLLMRNGIRTTGNSLEQTVVIALKNSNPFRADFLEMTAKYPEWAISYMATTDDYANLAGTADSSLNLTNSGTPKKSWFTGDNIQSTLNTALNAFLTIDKNKTDRALANSATNVAMYNSQTGNTTGGGTPPPKSNTTLYVILGVVGLALVGGIVYMATKKS